jgi:hypothetical protein
MSYKIVFSRETNDLPAPTSTTTNLASFVHASHVVLELKFYWSTASVGSNSITNVIPMIHVIAKLLVSLNFDLQYWENTPHLATPVL